MKIANRMGRIGTESAFEVGVRARALAAEGKDIIYLQIGEPDFDTPKHVVQAVGDALEDGQTHYGPSLGVTELRQAIATYLAKWRGVEVPWQRVVVTPGGKPPMFYTIMALIEPGDEVIYPNPGFPIYESMINFAGGHAVPLPIREELDWDFDPAEFEKLLTPKTKLVILNSPANPTGGVMSTTTMERVVKSLAKFPDAM